MNPREILAGSRYFHADEHAQKTFDGIHESLGLKKVYVTLPGGQRGWSWHKPDCAASTKQDQEK